jgi:hypothetical protein
MGQISVEINNGITHTCWETEGSVVTSPRGVMSAAEFGRSVGLRDGGHFIAMIDAGYTPAMTCVNPKTGRSHYRVEANHISFFHRRFAAISTLAAETGHHRNTVRSILKTSLVARFAPGDRLRIGLPEDGYVQSARVAPTASIRE